jgi:ribosomal protein S18 acetylase RimI-like enzyme
MTNNTAVGGSKQNTYAVSVLDETSAGEIRAAYVTEAAAHNDFAIPPLTQTLDELRDELLSAEVTALGVREHRRLIGAVRLRHKGRSVEVGRLTVAPDRQGQGIGSFLLREAEFTFSETEELRLFTGERSAANIRLYERSGYVEVARTPVGDYSIVHFVKILSPLVRIKYNRFEPELNHGHTS